MKSGEVYYNSKMDCYWLCVTDSIEEINKDNPFEDKEAKLRYFGRVSHEIGNPSLTMQSIMDCHSNNGHNEIEVEVRGTKVTFNGGAILNPADSEIAKNYKYTGVTISGQLLTYLLREPKEKE